MMNTLPIRHFWQELVRVTKDYWIQVAIFCVFAAAVFFVIRVFFNL